VGRRLYEEGLWVRHCESNRAGDLDGAEAEGPDPGSWRCPLCHGPIVPMYLKRERVDPRTGDPRSLNGPGEPAVRAGFRCRRSVCGWNDWVMWFMSEQ